MSLSKSKKRGQTGFTLLEMVVVMVLLGLVSSMTLPAMQRWHAGLVAKSEASAIVEALQTAAFESGVQKRSLVLDQSSFTSQPHDQLTDTKSGQVYIQLPAGWQVRRTVPAIFGADGLCKPGLAALRSATGTALIFQVHGPLCRVEWALDHSGDATSRPGS